jgi:hypothetical protein
MLQVQRGCILVRVPGLRGLRLLDRFPQRDGELGFARLFGIVEGVAGAVAFGGLEEESLFDAVWQAGKARFAIDIGPDFEIELVEAAESIGDVNFHFGGIDGLVIGAGDGEVGGAGAQSGVNYGNGMRIGGLRLGKGNQQEQG